jgi:hypothetical protein
MRTFNEWMQIRSSNKAITDWHFITDLKTDEARQFLEERGLFRNFEILEASESEGQTVIAISGEPVVTLFELESLGIRPAV